MIRPHCRSRWMEYTTHHSDMLHPPHILCYIHVCHRRRCRRNSPMACSMMCAAGCYHCRMHRRRRQARDNSSHCLRECTNPLHCNHCIVTQDMCRLRPLAPCRWYSRRHPRHWKAQIRLHHRRHRSRRHPRRRPRPSSLSRCRWRRKSCRTSQNSPSSPCSSTHARHHNAHPPSPPPSQYRRRRRSSLPSSHSELN